ncbi:Kinesin-like protein KIF20A, partial [Stegodyphus mimosarum]
MSLSPALDFSPEYNMAAVSRKLESEFISIQDKNMCVYARVRPLLQKEEESGYNACIGVIDEETVRAVVPPNSLKYRTRNQDIIEDFKYTAAFGPEIGQFVFFEETMCNPMQDFIEGKNSLIFSYGITGSGKTYTFQGDEENPGIITLALRLFFASIEHQLSNRIFFKPDKFADINHLSDEEIEKEQKLKEQLLSMQRESGNLTGCSTTAKKSFAMSLCEAFSDNFKFEERETTLPFEEMSAAQSAMQMKELCKKCADKQSGSCTVWVSFVEIYNENVYDLLQPNINLRTRLTLGEDKNGDVYIKGLREVCISNYEEALGLLDLGRKTLKIASTKLNYQSSRSHCIYTIKVVRLIDEDNMTVRINRLAFCDLAGSERASKAQTTGLRLKEAGCINTSLLVLGRCLEQLRANQNLKDKRLIPFRESKLTRLFSGFFLGKGSAVMIANASPCDYTFDETLNVLKFSALAKELMINDSYMSMASSSLQSISNQWAKARQRISDASEGNQTIDMDYTAEEIQE